VIDQSLHLVHGRLKHAGDTLDGDRLRAFAATIAGGTAQIQRDIIGMAGLGLPRERRRRE